MVLKIKPKLNSKFMLKGGNTIKTMKGSKKESKRYMFCVYKRTRNINILWQQGNSYYIILFLALVYVWAPHGHIKCKVNWKRAFKRLPNWGIYWKECFLFLDPVKKFRRNHQNCSIKNALLKNSTIFKRKYLCWSPFSSVLETLKLY